MYSVTLWRENLKPRVSQKMRDVVCVTCQQVIKAQDLVAPFEEVVAEMAAQETGSTSHNDS